MWLLLLGIFAFTWAAVACLELAVWLVTTVMPKLMGPIGSGLEWRT